MPDELPGHNPPAGGDLITRPQSPEAASYWLRAVVDSAEDAIITKTLDGVITSWNKGAQRIFGYAADEVIGQPVTILIPEDYLDEEPGILARIKSGQRVEHYQTVRRRKDGSLIDISLTVSPIRGPEGVIIGASKIARDVTQHKRAQEQLRAQAEVIAQAYDAIFLRDSANAITLWNRGAERTYGYTKEEALGRSPHELLKTEPPVPLEAIYESLRREGFWEGDLLHTRKDGERINVESRWATVRDARGEVTSVLEITRDVTERRRAEEERARLLESESRARLAAEQANRVKDEFLATLSHELRTPLTSILGWSRMLQGGQLGGEASLRALETIQRNAQLQSQLIEDVLDVSRIVSGKMRLEVRPVELSAVIEAAIDSVLPAAEAKGVRLQRVLDSGASLVSGDANRLQQVVWNLLTNAIKFTPKGGRVQVRLERVNSHVEIVVSDTGAGIPADVLPHVFERFRQADSSTTRKHGGLGLGLSIVRHLVEMHGGTAAVESEGEGLGATFTVTLPLVATRPAGQGLDAGRVHPTASEGVAFDCPAELVGLRVLVVDDEEDARALIAAVLEKCEAKVTAVSSAAEALAAIEEVRPDVLLSDLGMPDEDGYSLIARVRALPASRGGLTPAAALTAYARVEDRMRVLRSGFQIHLPKPVEPAELVAVVANLAGRVGVARSERGMHEF